MWVIVSELIFKRTFSIFQFIELEVIFSLVKHFIRVCHVSMKD